MTGEVCVVGSASAIGAQPLPATDEVTPYSMPSRIPSPSLSGLFGSVWPPPGKTVLNSSASEIPSQSVSIISLFGLFGSAPLSTPPPLSLASSPPASPSSTSFDPTSRSSPVSSVSPSFGPRSPTLLVSCFPPPGSSSQLQAGIDAATVSAQSSMNSWERGAFIIDLAIDYHAPRASG